MAQADTYNVVQSAFPGLNIKPLRNLSRALRIETCRIEAAVE